MMSNSATKHKGIDRDDIYNEIKMQILSNPDNYMELKMNELADRFNVSSPTLDYHLDKLVQEGKLILSKKRGKYKRKIYRLPNDVYEKEKQNKKSVSRSENQQNNILTPDAVERFKDFLSSFTTDEVKIEKENEEEHTTTTADEVNIQETKEETPRIHDLEKEDTKLEIPKKEETPKKEESYELDPKPLTLDERIEKFLNEAKQVHEADMLLQHEDREILSVINETIHENMVFLKDLSEQLSTIQNKKLIQALIDERNQNKEYIQRLEKEVKQARELANQTKDKYQIDPNRVRFMQQMIVATIDDYVNQPNHALALGRRDFRNKVTKEVSDLVRYVLGLEK